jgi:hypothetical protein
METKSMQPAPFRALSLATLATALASCGGDSQGFAARYTIGGALTGLTGPGVTILLNGSDNLSLTSNGSFDFRADLDSGTKYSVTVLTQPAGQYCSVTNGIGTLATSSVVNVGISCAATNPQLLSYEGFNYIADQALPGRNGGVGWAGAWRVVDGALVTDTPLPSTSSGTVTNGLNYTDALSNRLITTDGAWRTDAGVFFGQGRRASVSNFGAAGTTRWISFLVRQAAASTTPATPHFNYVSGTLGTGYSFGSPAMMGDVGLYAVGGIAAAGAFYDNAAAGVALPPSWAENSVGLVVLRIDFNASSSANDTLSLWFNPSLSVASPGTPLVSASLANYADAINGITMSWGDYRSFVIDEVRIGTDYAAVTPYQ